MKTRASAISGFAFAAWAVAFHLVTRDTIPLGYAIIAVVTYLGSAIVAGVFITVSASDPRGDGKESIAYGLSFVLLALSVLLPLLNLILAFSGYYLNPRLVGVFAAIVVLGLTPAAVLLAASSRHHASWWPRLITPGFAICSALLCRMFYR